MSAQESEAGKTENRAKAIVLFSDGTGNSAGKAYKTNVWRLYQALDQRPPKIGEMRQIAYYDDGVGTSSFRPLAILGGVFGYGLKRNVLDLYAFLCRNYEPGDRIYAFGFSRGAFTIRVLIGFVLSRHLVRAESEAELARGARDAYRAYRRRFEPAFGPTRVLVTILRDLRDGVIGALRRFNGHRTYAEIETVDPGTVAFVGVFDTVSAYGMPIAEITRGIDDYVFPLSMPNYSLSDKVEVARHALALDDERDTFHPLLWDERREAMLVGDEQTLERLQQVWFVGVHSDVGGGYPDDALSHVPLEWMMDEAASAGLRFKQEDADDYRRAANPFGPLHNSRNGLGAYYRYQPRKISPKLADSKTGKR